METSFCELKGKEVINIVDGKKLGRIIDLVFETCNGRVLGIVVPAYNKSWNIFKSSEDIFIPFNCICKFGDDAILVKIFVATPQNVQKKGRFVKTANKSIPENLNKNKTSTQNSDLKQDNLSNQYNNPNFYYDSNDNSTIQSSYNEINEYNQNITPYQNENTSLHSNSNFSELN